MPDALPTRWAHRVRRLLHRVPGLAPAVHTAPVFLLGHPKSGTTAIGSLLARATGLPVTLDLFQTYGIARAEAAALIEGRLPMTDFVRAHRYAFATPLQKCPKLTFAFDALREHFPEARFALIVRDPRDTLRSFLFRRGLPGDAERLPRPLALLPALPGDTYVERLAHRWNRAADVALAHPGAVVRIRYEDFVQDKPGEIARLARSLGLDAPHDITPWLDVAFKPRSRTGTSWPAFFGPDNLARITAICGTRMQALGYDLATPPQPALSP